MCGKPVTDDTVNRFGEWCCSEAHAEAYVADVHKQKPPAIAAPEPPTRPRRGCC